MTKYRIRPYAPTISSTYNWFCAEKEVTTGWFFKRTEWVFCPGSAWPEVPSLTNYVEQWIDQQIRAEKHMQTPPRIYP